MSEPTKKLTRRLEDYLEAVWVLTQEQGAARVRDIAARTDVTMSSVTSALKQLARGGLVHYDPYQLVTLTARGESLAERIHDKHDALRGFLVEVLDLDPHTAEANACRMEHVVDDEVLHRLSLLARFLQQRRPEQEEWIQRFGAYCRSQGSSPQGRTQPSEPPARRRRDRPGRRQRAADPDEARGTRNTK